MIIMGYMGCIPDDKLLIFWCIYSNLLGLWYVIKHFRCFLMLPGQTFGHNNLWWYLNCWEMNLCNSLTLYCGLIDLNFLNILYIHLAQNPKTMREHVVKSFTSTPTSLPQQTNVIRGIIPEMLHVCKNRCVEVVSIFFFIYT